MNLRLGFLILIMLALGIAASLVFGNQSAVDVNAESGVDTWQAPTQPINYSNSGDRFLNALSSGRLFPNIARRIEQTEEEFAEETGPTIFPTLISISRLDGTFKAFVQYENGEMATLQKGDPLVGDWTVAEMSNDALVAQLESDMVRIPLFLSD